MKTTKTDEKTKPIKKAKSGTVQGSIWENTGKGKDGKEYKFYKVTIDNSYKDGEDWQKTNSYDKKDIASLKAVVDSIYNYMYLDDLD